MNTWRTLRTPLHTSKRVGAVASLGLLALTGCSSGSGGGTGSVSASTPSHSSSTSSAPTSSSSSSASSTTSAGSSASSTSASASSTSTAAASTGQATATRPVSQSASPKRPTPAPPVAGGPASPAAPADHDHPTTAQCTRFNNQLHLWARFQNAHRSAASPKVPSSADRQYLALYCNIDYDAS